MKGYKGFDKDFKCRGIQYAVGKTAKHGEMTYTVDGRTYYAGSICDGRCVPSYAARATRYYCFTCGYDIPVGEYRQHIEDQRQWHAQRGEVRAIIDTFNEVSKEQLPGGFHALRPRLSSPHVGIA